MFVLHCEALRVAQHGCMVGSCASMQAWCGAHRFCAVQAARCACPHAFFVLRCAAVQMHALCCLHALLDGDGEALHEGAGVHFWVLKALHVCANLCMG